MASDKRDSSLKSKYASYLGQTKDDYVKLSPKTALVFQGRAINERQLDLIKSHANDMFVRDGLPLYVCVIKALEAHLNGEVE